MAGESADVQLIDDAVFPRHQGRRIFLPVVARSAQKKAATNCCLWVWLGERAPGRAVGEHHSGRVEQDGVAVETAARRVGAVDAPAVLEAVGQSLETYVPVMAGAVPVRIEINLRGFVVVERFNNEADLGAMLAQQ